MKDYYFDSDCMSSFLKTHRIDIIENLYKKHIVIPRQVYKELNVIPYFKKQLDELINSGSARIFDMQIKSKEFELYLFLTIWSKDNTYPIGGGEAACIALTKEYKGILASNNYKDIKKYIDEYRLTHITTSVIIKEALNNKLISKNEASLLWDEMVNENIWLPYNTLKEYLKKK